jgi:hypothetical protein
MVEGNLIGVSILVDCEEVDECSKRFAHSAG